MSLSDRENLKEDILEIDIWVDSSNARKYYHSISILIFLVVVILPRDKLQATRFIGIK